VLLLLLCNLLVVLRCCSCVVGVAIGVVAVLFVVFFVSFLFRFALLDVVVLLLLSYYYLGNKTITLY